jgi:hypothetical protein
MSSKIVTLSIDHGLSRVHNSLRSVCAQGVYQRGLKSVALSIRRDPGNLSRELAANGRGFSVDSLETYIEKTGDVASIYYLIERFLIAKADDNAATIAEASHLLLQLQQLNLQPRL